MNLGRQGEPSTAWMRAFGRTGTMGSDNFLADGPGFDYDIAGFQAGLDLYRREHGMGSAGGSSGQAGLSFGATTGNADVEHIIDGHWTHFGSKGWYLDAVAQATWYQDISASSQCGENVRTDGWGAIPSTSPSIGRRPGCSSSLVSPARSPPTPSASPRAITKSRSMGPPATATADVSA
ncbi:hypothetical protein C5748_05355 [Phyllobacterium phragmitis]|uniref:Autotransporter domain-containing protein n=1 Tax=Phyllobacterium phragmitis TaxID=2670329 RepID=A0A2S9IWA7_9HYPH|nr:hypothetical protein C5748_05355 [Phyllobacterium phragmitis]